MGFPAIPARVLPLEPDRGLVLGGACVNPLHDQLQLLGREGGEVLPRLDLDELAGAAIARNNDRAILAARHNTSVCREV